MASRMTCRNFFLSQGAWFTIALFLIFLPFQMYLFKKLSVPWSIRWVDELFVVTAMVIGLMKVSRSKILPGTLYFLASSMILFGVWSFFSGGYNGNKFLVTGLGTADYMKNFLPIIFLPLALNFSEEQLSKLYRVLRFLALILCWVALLQELLFLLGLDTTFAFIKTIRFGFLRVPSLLQHANTFGLYMLLFLILELCVYRRVSLLSVMFSLGAILCFSRVVWVAAMVCTFLIAWRYKKRAIYLLSILFALLLTLISLNFGAAQKTFWELTPVDSDMCREELVEFEGKEPFRGYALGKAIEIWKDQPIVGVGPGMFGGIISLKYSDLSIYKKYDFSEKWLDYMKGFNSLDQFWPQCFVEVGLIGAVLFAVMMVSVFYLCWRCAKKSKSEFLGAIFNGTGFALIGLYFFFLAAGLNATVYLLTVTTFLGLALGAEFQCQNQKS